MHHLLLLECTSSSAPPRGFLHCGIQTVVVRSSAGVRCEAHRAVLMTFICGCPLRAPSGMKVLERAIFGPALCLLAAGLFAGAINQLRGHCGGLSPGRCCLLHVQADAVLRLLCSSQPANPVCRQEEPQPKRTVALQADMPKLKGVTHIGLHGLESAYAQEGRCPRASPSVAVVKLDESSFKKNPKGVAVRCHTLRPKKLPAGYVADRPVSAGLNRPSHNINTRHLFKYNIKIPVDGELHPAVWRCFE